MKKILVVIIAAMLLTPAACIAGDKLVKAAAGEKIMPVPDILTPEEEADLVKHLDILTNLDFLLKLDFLEGYTGLYAVTESEEETEVK